MREILFRGKCQRGYDYSNGDGWVYGSLLQKGNLAAIVKTEDIESCFGTDDGISSIEDFACILVEPNTIGQYTGLTDKDGTKIFEGDTLTWDYADSKHFNEWMRNPYYKVVLEKGKFFATGIDITKKLYLHGFRFNNCEVIGNIHDDPKLIE